jgi:hypothetical protein
VANTSIFRGPHPATEKLSILYFQQQRYQQLQQQQRQEQQQYTADGTLDTPENGEPNRATREEKSPFLLLLLLAERKNWAIS